MWSSASFLLYYSINEFKHVMEKSLSFQSTLRFWITELPSVLSWLKSILLHLLKEIQSFVRLALLSMSSNECIPSDFIRSHSLSLHLVEKINSFFQLSFLSMSCNECIPCDFIRFHSSLLHQLEKF